MFENIELEQSILGAIIINNQYLESMADILEPQHFAYEQHQKLYKHIVLTVAEIKVDQLTLVDYFDNEKSMQSLGGRDYLKVLLENADSLSIRDYAKKIIELWQKRELHFICEKALEDLKEKKFDAVKSDILEESCKLDINTDRNKTLSCDEIEDEINADLELGKSTKIIPTGYSKLDSKIEGLRSKELVILGARPSVGKSSFCQNIIARTTNFNVLFFSLEVDRKLTYYKILAVISNVAFWKIKNNRLDAYEYSLVQDAKKKLKKLMINDSSNLKASDIEQITKNVISKRPIDLVIVDYVQYIRHPISKISNEAFLIKENTTALKNLAKKYDVAVLAAAQINRKGVETSKQEPSINDFKGSGGIEEDADVALILHRDRNEEKEESYFSNNAKVIIAKNRHGETGKVTFDFQGDIGLFTEIIGF